MAGSRANGSIRSLTPRTPEVKPSPTPPGAEWTLDAGRPKEIVERLLDRPDAARLVRHTPVQPLFLFIKSLGLADATDLLRLCSAEQVQAFLDLDCWQRDRLVPARVYPWLTALLELGYARLTAHVQRLDPQMLTTFLAPQLRVYELTSEEPPEEPQGLPFATPDRFFLVDIIPPADEASGETEDRQALLQRFLEALYRGDLELARVVLTSARWDGGTEAEEQAYRFRSGRMADLGYIDYYDALKVYMLVDPLKAPPAQPLVPSHAAPAGAKRPIVPAPEDEPALGAGGLIGPRSAVWRQLVPSLDASDFTFGRAVALLTPGEQARLFEHLMLLCNQAMAADRIELGDFDGTQQTLRRAMGYLSLGLEFRLRPLPEPGAQGTPPARELLIDPQHAAQILREVPLLYLFRLGYSLTLQLRKLATLLVHSSLTTLLPKEDPASLLPPEQAAPLRALLELRPLYSLHLDPQRTARAPHGSSRPSDEEIEAPRWREVRPFQSLRDLGRATELLELLSATDKLLTTGLGLRRETVAKTVEGKSPAAAAVKLHDLLGTMVANLLLDRPPALVPLARRDLATLRWRALGDAPAAAPGTPSELRPEVTAKVLAALQARVHERSLNETESAALWTPALQSFVHACLTRLATGLAALPPTLTDPQADAVPTVPGLILS
jgi:hypothetical protein